MQAKLLSGESPPASFQGNWQTHMARQKYWGSVYDELAPRGKIRDVEQYERLVRQNLARQPSIQDDILEALRANVCTSYRALISRYINGWCHASTIEHWFKLYEDYHIYNKISSQD